MINTNVVIERGNGYEVVLEGSDPLVILEGSSADEDRWVMDLRGVALLTIEEILGPPPPPARSPPPPPPPPPRSQRPPTRATRARAPRARRTASASPAATAARPSSGSASQAGDAEADDGGDDPDPIPLDAARAHGDPVPVAPPLGGQARRPETVPTIPPRASTPWLDSQEAAFYLRFPSVDALYQATRRGRVPAHPRAGRLLFHRDELDALLLGETKPIAPRRISPGVRRHRGGPR